MEFETWTQEYKKRFQPDVDNSVLMASLRHVLSIVTKVWKQTLLVKKPLISEKNVEWWEQVFAVWYWWYKVDSVRKRFNPKSQLSTVKHYGRRTYMVWGCFSARSITRLYHVKGIMSTWVYWIMLFWTFEYNNLYRQFIYNKDKCNKHQFLDAVQPIAKT